MNQTIHNLLTEQLASWEMARNNYAALSGVQVKELNVNGIPYKVQFNPARIVSSGAKVDAKSIKERKCFLCPANLPAEQRGVPFEGHYNILVNPFPIFPRHLTIPETAHVDQRIALRFGDMLDLAQQLTDYTIFYNGPKCGARPCTFPSRQQRLHAYRARLARTSGGQSRGLRSGHPLVSE